MNLSMGQLKRITAEIRGDSLYKLTGLTDTVLNDAVMRIATQQDGAIRFTGMDLFQMREDIREYFESRR